MNASGCERSEADRYIRFYCEEEEAFAYFTHEGRPGHTAYFIGPAYPSRRSPLDVVPRHQSGNPIIGGWDMSEDGRGAREQVRIRMEAYQAWIRDIFPVWRADTERLPPRTKRDRGKLYPLEPQ